MEPTNKSTGTKVLVNDSYNSPASPASSASSPASPASPYLPGDLIIALAGNPNVGKSTVFNALTGLNQHTGNWPGKTVTNARGKFRHKDRNFILVDIPGTYSLIANSAEEEVARDFICFGKPDAVIVVTDATCLERNLNLVLQILEITHKVVVCVNLIDEAKRKRIDIDFDSLSKCLGVPVIPSNARNGEGLETLMDSILDITANNCEICPEEIKYNNIIEHAINMLQPKIQEQIGEDLNSRWVSLKFMEGDTAMLKSIDKYMGTGLSGNSKILKLTEQAKSYLMKNGIQTSQLHDSIVTTLVRVAEEISIRTVSFNNRHYNAMDRKIDKIVTSRIFGVLIMLGLLSLLFWLTIVGANTPSGIISGFLSGLEAGMNDFFVWSGLPGWLQSMLVSGVYRTLSWVISVMLPPMAIFFPLFTLLEDLGYLPRIAFNLDNFFKKACTHGKQALTMCMGFGCNAAGVIGCRIIESPRERLIAIITNVFVPCNGRFPLLIAIGTIFISGISGSTSGNTPGNVHDSASAGISGTTINGVYDASSGSVYDASSCSVYDGISGNVHGVPSVAISSSFISALVITGIVLLGILMTLLISRILSKTLLKGLPSSFTLELPPYRKPQIVKVIARSFLDRTIFVLGRAVAVAAPAGLIIWLMANITVMDSSLLLHTARFLDPFGKMLGMDGYIILAFILGIPANETVIPILIMGYMSSGSLLRLEGLMDLRQLLVANGWTWLTGVCVMLFSIMHFPCATTLWTIHKETRSLKWVIASFTIPVATGIIVCLTVAGTARLLGLV